MRSLAATLFACLLAAPGLAQSTGKAVTQPAKGSPAKAAPTKSVPVAKAAPKAARRTTLSGVFTADEARVGRDMYALLCASCHTAVSHTGPPFRKKWAGRPLAELYTYMRTMMPKNEPASLADEDYAVLLAYMLQLNKMPVGKAPLSTDSSELAKIRIDTAKAVRKSKG